MEVALLEMDKLNQAFSRINLAGYQFNPLTDEEQAAAQEKGLTVLQYRLRRLYKVMLEAELEERKQEEDLLSGKSTIRISGLRLKEQMLSPGNLDAAEAVLAKWCNRLGISHIYSDVSACNDGCLFSNRNVYERFKEILSLLAIE